MRSNLSKALKAKVMQRDNYTCRYCGELAEHVDHIIPVAWKEINCLDNLVASCAKCNLKASDKVFNSFEDKRNWLLHRVKAKRIIEVEIKSVDKKEIEHWTDNILLEDFDENDDFGLHVFCLINHLLDIDDLVLLEDLL